MQRNCPLFSYNFFLAWHNWGTMRPWKLWGIYTTGPLKWCRLFNWHTYDSSGEDTKRAPSLLILNENPPIQFPKRNSRKESKRRPLTKWYRGLKRCMFQTHAYSLKMHLSVNYCDEYYTSSYEHNDRNVVHDKRLAHNRLLMQAWGLT